jgi:hypothetical protein
MNRTKNNCSEIVQYVTFKGILMMLKQQQSGKETAVKYRRNFNKIVSFSNLQE